ncbi:GLPGLI family protein [Psychroflexus salis]|uniref:GLPGLI family protein n=1 Tax=Psychroflexus salis TaxID=1526574 RepID=A0A916ZUC4_9FLAO|nr:GLPGLI family protein [Psychroflexus salis]GGE14539.1 hypothetical protein GCM10010831_14890 [Psychroflexus salis]
MLKNILLFLISFQAFSQGLEVTYGKIYTKDISQIENIGLRSRASDLKKNVGNIKYSLKINNLKNKSWFKYIEQMGSDFGQNNQFQISIGLPTEENFYNQKNNNNISLEEISGTTYYINYRNVEFEWEFNGNKKRILGYECKEIDLIYFINDIRGNKKLKYKVWLATELPTGYGPSIFTNFPGLVLGYKSENFEIIAEDLSIIENPEINFPNEEIIISLEDFKKLMSDMIDSLHGK